MKRLILAPLFVVATLFFASAPSLVSAQTATTAPALPVVPGSGRAADSASPASLPAVPGASPLEPYLVTWLLPVAGLVSVGMALFVDKKMRARMAGSTRVIHTSGSRAGR